MSNPLPKTDPAAGQVSQKTKSQRKKGRRRVEGRRVRRCKDCGCANCPGAQNGKVCDATNATLEKWKKGNLDRKLTRPSRSKLTACVRCGYPCWERVDGQGHTVLLGQKRTISGVDFSVANAQPGVAGGASKRMFMGMGYPTLMPATGAAPALAYSQAGVPMHFQAQLTNGVMWNNAQFPADPQSASFSQPMTAAMAANPMGFMNPSPNTQLNPHQVAYPGTFAAAHHAPARGGISSGGTATPSGLLQGPPDVRSHQQQLAQRQQSLQQSQPQGMPLLSQSAQSMMQYAPQRPRSGSMQQQLPHGATMPQGGTQYPQPHHAQLQSQSQFQLHATPVAMPSGYVLASQLQDPALSSTAYTDHIAARNAANVYHGDMPPPAPAHFAGNSNGQPEWRDPTGPPQQRHTQP